ncbi:uncharacterized protein PG998_007929 [Apiospora kogelbergensis]|uniref:uncharacterized protein n=1 Tax=Apiospora kogelbergensis TaxID=1337665 RepID=UPI003131B63E
MTRQELTTELTGYDSTSEESEVGEPMGHEQLVGMPMNDLVEEIAKPRDLEEDGWLAIPGTPSPDSRKLRQTLIMYGFGQGIKGNYAVGDDRRIAPTDEAHFTLSWISCIHDACTEQLAEKLENDWFPRRIGRRPIPQPHPDHLIGKIKTTIPDGRRAYLLVQEDPQWPRRCHLQGQDWTLCREDRCLVHAWEKPRALRRLQTNGPREPQYTPRMTTAPFNVYETYDQRPDETEDLRNRNFLTTEGRTVTTDQETN